MDKPRVKSRLNNMKLGFQRREMLYEAIMTDLYLMGALPKKIVEVYIGREIGDNLVPPPGGVLDDSASADKS